MERKRDLCMCAKDTQIRQSDRNRERVIVLEVEVNSSISRL